jgi:ABC-2 type transport system permease protein
MLCLGEVLILATNHLLDVTPFMMVLSAVTMFVAVFGIVALGMGFGAIYPKFDYQNIAQVATGFGGLMYMIFSALFVGLIIVLEAGPVYIIFMADVKGSGISPMEWLFIIPCFIMVLVISAFTVYKPMKMGLKALSQYNR